MRAWVKMIDQREIVFQTTGHGSRDFKKNNVTSKEIEKIISFCIQKSVGNALRDISKKFPELIKEELDGWDINSKEIQQVYKLASKFIK